MKAYLKSALNCRINKLENEKQIQDRGRINAVVQWSSEEHLAFLFQQIRDHEKSVGARGSYLVVPKVMSIDEWDAVAVPAQQRLYEAVRSTDVVLKAPKESKLTPFKSIR